MEHMLPYSLSEIPYVLLTLALAFSVHEFAHAYVAYKFGDPTAKNQGRLTLSPFAHLDLLGTLLIFLAGFGWARPVPVNRFHFKNPRLAGILVSVAGPLSNLVLAGLGFVIWYAMVDFGIMRALPDWFAAGFDMFFQIFIGLNAVLFVFNLLPFPPLDGYRIIEDLAPDRLRAKMTQWETYGALIFLILVLTPLDRYTIEPVFQVALPFVLEHLQTFAANLFT
ncbi:zinc metalloprotease [Geobacillus subterraneus]|uniref:Zinc metalloprotease n=2 Tax=Geobacillus TaxID=129337 RepID=A0ABN4NK24_9BACL|nr:MULTISPECIES: site-2 protease family protein [Geobacillus]AMX85031.1 zinc metalloprotease [Geobacillus subterraneus]KZS25745.1 zinc metalloprotease [Geobacillus subterraneus]OXB85229.1 site-2 protease family protein [Geobacillus uzenensis]QIZ66137.1 site-2 protease family protein [Geobacillus subterraneus]WPZ18337.1 site-2 protease family protein [Geobacillus subterraneus]